MHYSFGIHVMAVAIISSVGAADHIPSPTLAIGSIVAVHHIPSPTPVTYSEGEAHNTACPNQVTSSKEEAHYPAYPNPPTQPPARDGHWGFRGETIIEIDTKTLLVTIEAFQGTQVSCSAQAEQYTFDTALTINCEIEGNALEFRWAGYNEPMFACWTAPSAEPFKYDLQKYACRRPTATERGGCKFGFTNGPFGAVWEGVKQITYLDERIVGRSFKA